MNYIQMSAKVRPGLYARVQSLRAKRFEAYGKIPGVATLIIEALERLLRDEHV